MKSAFRLSCRILLLAAVLLAAGCRHGNGGKITLRFWNGFTGPDGRTMLRIVKEFNRENPDIDVLMQRMDWNTYYNKLFVAGLGHRAPDVFVVHTNAILRFAQAGFVRPIDDLVSGADGIDTHDLDPNVWRADDINGRHYGLPLDVHAMGMYYNRALFRHAGITDTQGNALPPRTRAEFLADLRRLTHPAPNGNGMQWGFVFTNQESNVYTIMRQYGGKFFTPDHSRCIMNNPQNVAALQFCVDLIRKEKVAPPPENFDAWVGFQQGKVGIAFEGIYMLADLQKRKDLDFGGAPVPLIGDIPAVWTNSHNLCLRADLGAKETRAAWRFVKFLSDHSLDWAAGGQIPARRSLRDSARFRAMTVQAQFARQIPYVTYMPQLPFVFEFNTEFDYAVEKALRGSATPQQALDTATANVNKIIARRREDEQSARGSSR
jgi:multiple sugar transport system substrate-binding protein